MPGRAFTAPLAFALAVVIAGCGSSSDGTIPENDASRLLGALALAQGDLEAGTCDVLISHVNEFSSAVDGLPNSVDDSVREELQKASQNLEQLAQEPDQCNAGATGGQGATETSTTSTTTTPTTTTTEETTTTDEDQEEKPDHGNGGAGGEGQTTPEESPPSEETEPPTTTSTTPPTGEQGGGQGEGSNGQNEGTDSGGVTGGKQ